MKTKVLFLLLVIVLNYSCTSEETNEIQEENNFYALKVGNSWSYSYYLKDLTTNSFNATTVTETVDITHTIEIASKTFFNFRYVIDGNNGSYSLLPDNGEKNVVLRDSLGFLIDHTGSIKYSTANYEEHIVDEVDDDFTYNLKLTEEVDTLITNAGTFSCLDNHYFYRYEDGTVSNAIDHSYRENGKGEILSTMSFSSQNDHFAEKRLEFYTLQ